MPNKGSKHTPVARAKIAESLRGHAVSPETRTKIGVSLRGNKNHWKGFDRKAWGKAYYAAHKEAYRIHDRAWKVAHKKECAAQQKVWYAANRERASATSKNCRLRQKYGLTLASFEALLVNQGGVCAICRRPIFGKRDTHVDHNHATGKVRGLLCDGCNPGIALLKDSPTIMRLAAEYVEKNNL